MEVILDACELGYLLRHHEKPKNFNSNWAIIPYRSALCYIHEVENEMKHLPHYASRRYKHKILVDRLVLATSYRLPPGSTRIMRLNLASNPFSFTRDASFST